MTLRIQLPTSEGREPAEGMSELWDVKQVAAYLHASESWIYKLVRTNRIPHERAGSRMVRFRKGRIDSWLSARGS